ncbi:MULTISPECIES: cytochrome c [unclassified Beijerinckia]|uniref:cytochrome c n=1 Tax=unclassified Beijerinckia TaxID=2638183 RepID=UPI0008956416|nr:MULTISPECIES: cytochrome c [unclassified Beijerinckia]MDH7795435.1 mono/diheme cytochrome c family protein [Beijerinckia sp. GAS462]SEC01471.1 Cytochrome c, mono-and diheme variants [Beijerinckia sp. 28-YEA-48]
MSARKLLWAVVLLVVCGALVAGSIFFGLFGKSVVAKDIDQPLSPEQMKTLAQRGAYVAVAADCYACHTTTGGAPWAGGLPFKTPFGTIYSTNISSDPDHGIGNWTRAEFHRAVRDGVGKGGRHLYPAMPYASYRKMTPDDVDAVYAYLMSRPPMKVANPANELTFPFNIRQGLTFWNLVNLSGDTQTKDAARSDLWNRGRYLVDALAHCGECHTPRNITQGVSQSRYLQGALLEGLVAPDVTKDGLTRMGFTPQLLASFMKSGLSAQGAMTNQMYEVVHFSTQYMTKDDLDAMSAYLFGLDALPQETTPPALPKPIAVAADVATSARGTYLGLCASCHGAEGQGIPHVVVPLATNASLRLASARNLIHTTLNGIPARRFPGLERMQPMPAFKDDLDDRQMADLANWMRATWGGEPPNVKTEDVAAIRKGD